MEHLFSVIDTETTGLNAKGGDRIAEIAIVTVDRNGDIIERWETLVNPGRDLGKSSIHGITAAEILDAPSFEEIAEEVMWRLSGTIPVAHNLPFDASFLDAELRRAGWAPHPSYFADGLCTLRLSRRYLDAPVRNLQALCEALGLCIDRPHSAGDDAEAAASLLGVYIASEPVPDFYDLPFESASFREWSYSEPSVHPRCRLRGTADSGGAHFLEQIVDRLPSGGANEDEGAYLDLIDRALLDRHISVHEEFQLIRLAAELGIGRRRAEMLHEEYYCQLLASAFSDGVLTDKERADLDAVATLLAIDPAQADQLISAAMGRKEVTPSKFLGFHLEVGDLIVLTGDMSCSRSSIEEQLVARGYRVHPNVTKKVKLVVAADPDSLSGKAKKARDYGISVVGESYLWDVLLAD